MWLVYKAEFLMTRNDKNYDLKNVRWEVRGVKFNWDDHTLLKVSKTEMSKIPQKVGFNLA